MIQKSITKPLTFLGILREVRRINFRRISQAWGEGREEKFDQKTSKKAIYETNP